MKTKHCEQLKQAALQFPWARCCSSGNIGCQAICDTQQSTVRNIFSLIWLNLTYCELTFSIFVFPF
jgi:hypothetical protein